jgi:hypothetical protein
MVTKKQIAEVINRRIIEAREKAVRSHSHELERDNLMAMYELQSLYQELLHLGL